MFRHSRFSTFPSHTMGNIHCNDIPKRHSRPAWNLHLLSPRKAKKALQQFLMVTTHQSLRCGVCSHTFNYSGYVRPCFGGCCGIGKSMHVILKFLSNSTSFLELCLPLTPRSRKHNRTNASKSSHPQPSCDKSHLIMSRQGVAASGLTLLF